MPQKRMTWKEAIAQDMSTHGALHPGTLVIVAFNKKTEDYDIEVMRDSSKSLYNVTEEQVIKKLKEWNISPDSGWL